MLYPTLKLLWVFFRGGDQISTVKMKTLLRWNKIEEGKAITVIVGSGITPVVLAGGSALAAADLGKWPYLIPVTVEGYRQYFEKNDMI